MIWTIISIVVCIIALFLLTDNKMKSDRIKVLKYALFFQSIDHLKCEQINTEVDKIEKRIKEIDQKL
ncbi:competence protein ComGF [Staphylococcus auricularis]|uniref:DUF1514 domain-containing protein n=1 Tax=Staphylococcus auricularis TaxID=29379 RepID=A0AAW7M803_9STAP|nr:hypothetical protein [Staphylococcus auricularis]MBM0868924.1 hypothetical protein [Staphylococcus auricularis]MCG7342365.1 hypothetical protein [Staphylococcus auricularis]MDC6328238.1 hypothetical protein [Staphylococcus auricularis]MDN4532171.1 hypothetical protein [Staphylococcus auricularis]